MAKRALFVPAPTSPNPKIALSETSESLSWLYLFNTSTKSGSGFEIEDKARAKGTARRAGGVPYLPIYKRINLKKIVNCILDNLIGVRLLTNTPYIKGCQRNNDMIMSFFRENAKKTAVNDKKNDGQMTVAK